MGMLINSYRESLVYPDFIGNRAIAAAGNNASFFSQNVIDYWNMAGSPANATDFGDLSVARGGMPGCASNGTYALSVGGQNNTPTAQSTMDRVTIGTTGNASNLGALTQARAAVSACGNTTRGIASGGNNTGATVYNIIDYWNPAAPPTHNATDFGDLINNLSATTSGASTTRGVISGGNGANADQISYVTLASAGNATTFGTLPNIRTFAAAASDGTTMVMMGHGESIVAFGSTADKLTIATTGNATLWGNLVGRRAEGAGMCNGPRIMCAGGTDTTGGTRLNNIEYAAMTDSSMADFGDLTVTRYALSGCSGT